MSTSETPHEVTLSEVNAHPASVAWMAQHHDVLVTDQPGITSEAMRLFAGAVRRAAKRTGDRVHVEFTGSAGLRVRKFVR